MHDSCQKKVQKVDTMPNQLEQLKVWGLFDRDGFISLHRTKEGAEKKIEEQKRNDAATRKLMGKDIEGERIWSLTIHEIPILETPVEIPISIQFEGSVSSGYFYHKEVAADADKGDVKWKLYNVILTHDSGVVDTIHLLRDDKNDWIIRHFEPYPEMFKKVRAKIDEIENSKEL